MVDTSKCPCGSNKTYNDCCKALHQGLREASTAEELMRSRYTAYVKKLKDYLVGTWHSSQQAGIESLSFDSNLRWLGLQVTATKAGLENDSEGEVEFIASYRYHNQSAELKEHSRFIKEDGRWYYAGSINP